MNKNECICIGDCFDKAVFLFYEHEKKRLNITPINENALSTMLIDIYGSNSECINLDQSRVLEIVNFLGKKASEPFIIDTFEVMSLNGRLGTLSLLILNDSPKLVVNQIEIDTSKFQLNPEYVKKVFTSLAYGLTIPEYDQDQNLISKLKTKSRDEILKNEPLNSDEIQDIILDVKSELLRLNHSSFDSVKNLIFKKLKDTGNSYVYSSEHLAALVNQIFLMV